MFFSSGLKIKNKKRKLLELEREDELLHEKEIIWLGKILF